MYWVLFLIAFIVMMIAEGVAMFPIRRCDEYCDKEAWKLICLEYVYRGLVDSC
jgi:hypothetical protein